MATYGTIQQVNTLREENKNNNYDVNNIVDTINNIWQSSAKSSFRKRKQISFAQDDNNFSVKHKWVNKECKQSRINHRKNKDSFRRNKSS